MILKTPPLNSSEEQREARREKNPFTREDGISISIMILSLAERKLIAKWHLGASGEQTELLPPHKDKWYIAENTFPFSTVLFNTCVVQSKRIVPVWELCPVWFAFRKLARDSAEPQPLTAPAPRQPQLSQIRRTLGHGRGLLFCSSQLLCIPPTYGNSSFVSHRLVLLATTER